MRAFLESVRNTWGKEKIVRKFNGNLRKNFEWKREIWQFVANSGDIVGDAGLQKRNSSPRDG